MSIFSKVSLKKPKRSTFNLSYDRKMSLRMGDLVPCHIQEVVPGDRITMSTEQLLRMAPMIAPVMHEVNVYVHYFFVPNRIIWKGWEDFITGGEDGLDVTLFPTTGSDQKGNVTIEAGDLGDYLGLPLNLPGSIGQYPNISRLPFMAYQKIWEDYYRDQNLQEKLDDISDVDGFIPWQEFGKYRTIRRRAWQHDYFTSALPWAQKGNPVNLPIAGQLPLSFDEDSVPNGVNAPSTIGTASSAWTRRSGVPVKDLGGDVTISEGGQARFESDGRNVAIDVSANHYVDLEEGTATSINDLRTAFRLQEWLERNARAGSRYVESILSHFGVNAKDARLQRPEYLGGNMSPVMISEVLQTSETATSPQANMAGHGLNVGKGGGFSKFVEEHGYIIGIMSVMPRTSYQQGIPRHFSKFDKFDYFWPEFQHIGEQEIKNKELIAMVAPPVVPGWDPEGTFGYIPRYAEYKYNPSTVHGDFKHTLDFWHMGRIFDHENPPVLNAEFIMADPTTRIFAVEGAPENGTLYCHMFHKITANRPMSYFGDPSFRI